MLILLIKYNMFYINIMILLIIMEIGTYLFLKHNEFLVSIMLKLQ